MGDSFRLCFSPSWIVSIGFYLKGSRMCSIQCIPVRTLAACFLVFATIASAPGQEASGKSRLWSDATGKFKIDAVMLDRNANAVRLQKTDGRVITVPVSKLSKNDQDYLKSLDAEPDENPFAGGAAPVMNRKIAQVGDNLNVLASFACDDIQPLPSLGTELMVGGTELPGTLSPDPGDRLPTYKPFSALVADTDAYDKLQPPLILDSSAGLFAVSVGRHKAGDSDNRRGRVFLTRVGSPHSDAAIDAGETIDIMDHHEPSDRTLAVIGKGSLYRGGEICLIEGLKSGTATVRLRRTLPGIEKPGFKPQVEWARLIDGDHVIAKVNDNLYCWNLIDNRLVYQVPGLRGQPTLSPGGKYMAIPHTGKAAIVSTPTAETLGTISALNPHLVPDVHFDPTGSRLALVAGNQVAVWNLANAKMDAEITTLNPSGTFPGWVDERHILTQLAGLIDIELGLPIWHYSLPSRGMVTMIDRGIVVIDSMRGAKIIALPVPHPAALQSAKRLAASGDEMYIIRPGSEVSIKVESTGDVSDTKIRDSLAKAVERAGWVVADSADTTLVAKIGRGDQQTLQYQMRTMGLGRGSNDTKQTATITPFTMSFEIQQAGKTLWSRKSENYVPRMIFLRDKNETLQDAVSKYERPDAGFFERLTLPPRILKDQVLQAVGRSRLDTQGWKE